MNNKLVIWGADVGYTQVFDMGCYKTLEAGIVTHADVMLDAQHAQQALIKLKNMPWISIGWHRHLWEKPFLPASEIPHMVDKDGRFKWRHKHPELMQEVPYEEAYREFMEEAEFCKKNSGRYPDTTCFARFTDTPLEKAFVDVCNQLDIKMDIFIDDDGTLPTSEKYISLNYHIRQITPKHQDNARNPYDLSFYNDYDPIKSITSIELDDNTNYVITWHPGYLDEYILAESTCTVHRVKELTAALSAEFRNWIIQNKLILCSERDILNGTNEVQLHLQKTNSPLWAGNF